MRARLAAFSTSLLALAASCGGDGGSSPSPPSSGGTPGLAIVFASPDHDGTIDGQPLITGYFVEWWQSSSAAGPALGSQLVAKAQVERRNSTDLAIPVAVLSMPAGTELVVALTARGSFSDSDRSGLSAPFTLPASAGRSSVSSTSEARMAATIPVPASSGGAVAGTTADGLPFVVEVVADQLVAPTGVAATPDGRVLVAERHGRVRVLPATDETSGSPPSAAASPAVALEPAPDVRALLGLALDAAFDETRFVFALEVVDARRGPSGQIVRYREVANTLGEPAVLVADLPLESTADAAFAVSPDGIVHVGLPGPDGGMVRLDRDGRHVSDGPGPGPFVAAAPRALRALGWDRDHRLWMVEAPGRRLALTRAGRGDDAARMTPRIERPLDPRAGLFYLGDRLTALAGDLLVTSTEGPGLWRVPFADGVPDASRDAEPLLGEQFGPLGALAVAPDGTVLVSTRLARDGGSAWGAVDRLLRVRPR
jgi:glucose/arabinose dehydrogenase